MFATGRKSKIINAEMIKSLLDNENVNTGEVKPDIYSSDSIQDTIVCNEHLCSDGMDGHTAVEVQGMKNMDPVQVPVDAEQYLETPRSRKRFRNIGKWKKNIRRRLLQSGNEYVSTTGNTVDARTFKFVDCQCPMKCSDQITEDRQRHLHGAFYAIADWSMQSAYVAGHIRVSSKKRTYTVSASSRRSNSLQYFLTDSDGLDIHVCKAFFKGVIGVSDGRISRVLKKRVVGTPLTDRRGNHVPHNKTPDSEQQYVREFIGKFPTYTSHYSRKKNPNRSYLTPDMNISRMYKLFKMKCREERPFSEPISEHVFRSCFNRDFNLHFHAPLQDTCKTCDILNAKIKFCDTESDLHRLKVELEIHQRKADSARTSLQEDTARSKILEIDLTVLTFDLQKTLPTPVLSTGICYYKRQLWTYNLGIHCMNNDVGYMYVWDESEASRGPEEIASALLYHIKKHVKTSNLICYSDCCGGQNRNIKMALMWNYVVLSDQTTVNIVDHKFLIPGHTYLPNDQDFGLIEKNKKFHSDIFVPADWVRVIQSAKKRKPEFIVTKLTKSDFFSTKQLEENSTNRKTDESGQKVMWLKIHWLHFNKLYPYHIDFKYCVNEDAPFMSVDVGKHKRGRQQEITNVSLSLLYPDGKKIAKAKILDLKSLMPFVPPIHHNFYKQLKSDASEEVEEIIWTDSDDEDNIEE